MADRESTLFGEIRRMARTSGAVGGIAARVAGQRFLGLKTDKAAHAEDLKAILGGLKGPLMKVAQILTTIPDALPAEYAAELAQLQANAPPMGWAFVRRRMQSEMGPAWQSKFREFGQEAAAAASLGQVHRATLPDGRVVACKLQYPDMPSVVEADLRQLRLAMSLYHRIDSAIQHDDVYEELSERLREELDYLREAAQMRLYGIMLRGEPSVSVPVPVEGYCTRRLLTMQWLDGRALQARLDEDPPQEERNDYARALFRAWYVPFYRYGVIHGDPHMGNYQIRTDDAGHGVNLLDYGAIRVFPARFVRGTIMLYEAVRDGDKDKAHAAYESWGFTGLSREKMEVLNLWAHFLYEPLLQDRPRRIQESDDPAYGRKVAEQVHAGLKRTGGVRPPREFVLMDRAAVGLGSVFLRLKAEVNWYRLVHELIEEFDEAEVAARQAAALREAGVPGAA
ncbi:AarF/ABC1/UbiB kinase family protein [Roseomonas sp. NAR14]|uniref:AarF/ABC1/UbiB kinase family protein n=1 Tax=Roseomonas acroporae TaxID=2937791 RepID=A0A9X2BSD8_9PROT|nr:AarF/ABC1/UbiB kinase family protein [Roseomonas acroporae]MCK8783463.1 AarF/ABC1/UbiB kinase family protein [Roseomonas acroporae]